MQAPAPILVADRFPKLLEGLLDLLTGLSPSDWDLPTTLAGWTVKDVALHLLGVDLGYLSRKRDAFSEAQPPLETWDELVTWLNEFNQRWVQAARRISPRLLCDLLKISGDQFNRYVSSLDALALGGPVSWAGPGPAPVWLDIAREFTERWHHQQHIREAVGKAGLMGPYYLAPVLAAFAYALPRTYREIEGREGIEVTLTITGEAGGSWTVRREQRGWQLYAGRPEKPEAEVVLPEQAAWRLFTKGLAKEAATRQAQLLGDQALANQMLETVSIIA